MNDRRNAHAVRCENSSASYAQRNLFFLLAVASLIFLSSLLLPAPAVAQTVDPCAATGMELLNTDIWGYQSGDTVHFDGTGYAPNCSYPITVIEPTNRRVSTDLVTTDAAGNFAYDYLIVNGVQEVYLARITGNDGNDLASVMFSDAAPCDATVPSGLFPTIQSAVSALPNANPGTACVITVLAGTYNEAINVGTSASGKNLGAGLNDSLRYIIQADPAAAPGAVVINPFSPVNMGLQGFNIRKSQFITIAGFGITGANPSAGSAITLMGGGDTNNNITIEANLIYNNAGGDTGSNSSNGGINIQGNGNARTWIINNLIRNNSRSGIFIGGSSGIGPVYIVNNTIYSNGFSGISTIPGATLHVINNLLIRNGVNGPASELARYGLNCDSCLSTTALNRTVKNNLFYANARGDLNAVTHWIESSPPDSGNYTPSATWTANGAVTASGVAITSCVFPPACGTGEADTTIFADTTNFRLQTSPMSPAIDKGLNNYVSSSLEWVPSTSNTRDFAPDDDFEADLRPQNGGVSSTVDIGYDEAPVAIITYTVDASVSGGHGSVSPASQTVNSGDNASISISPDAGYHIASITDNAVSVAIANPYVITNVTAVHTVVVTFAIDTFAVNASVSGGHGTVSPASQTVNSGDNASIGITPDAGYHIASITDSAVSVAIANPYVITNVTAVHTVVVTFAIDTFAVNASVSGGHGTVSPASQTVNSGDNASIGISPDPGYHIASITDNAVSVAIANPYVITNVTAVHTVVVTFAIDTFAVNASVSGGHGSVSPASQTVNSGDNASIGISPDAGYHIASITDNAVSVAIANPYVITNVTAAHTVVVTFAADTGCTLTNFSGFFPPVDNPPKINSVKAGQGVPVKFSCGGNQGLNIFAGGYPAVSAPMSCNGSQDPTDPTATAGQSSLQYDATSGQYIYVWKTDKAWAGQCRQLLLKFSDGTSLVFANFQFK